MKLRPFICTLGLLLIISSFSYAQDLKSQVLKQTMRMIGSSEISPVMQQGIQMVGNGAQAVNVPLISSAVLNT